MIPLVKKLDIDEINTSLIAIRKLLNNVGITETNITNIVGKDYDAKIQELEEKITADDTYSTTEVKTGKKWIDGKPIYRVVRHVWHNDAVVSGYSWNSGNRVYTGQFTTNAETVIEISALIHIYNSTSPLGWQRQYASGWDGSANIIWQGDNQVYHYVGASSKDTYIIIEYTKTTD